VAATCSELIRWFVYVP